jgi:peptide/nickel transport system substrate-binding protein
MRFRWVKHITMTVAITVAFLGGMATVCHAGKETLIVSEMWEIDGVDAAKNGTFVKEKALIAETLVDAATDFSLKPQLATSWKMTGDTVWEFTLREDVRFHNGAPLTAEVVVSSLKRAMAINPSLAKLTMIKDVRAKDKLTVEVETTTMSPALPASLVYPDTAITHPESEMNEQGEVIRPIGTGPYVLKEWNQAEHKVLLTRFADYWGNRPKIKQILYRSIPDPSTRSLEIQKGSVDLVAEVPYGDLDLLRKKGLDVTIANTARVYLLNFGKLQNTVFSDPKVRNALSRAINRQEIVQYILFGMGKPAAGGYEKSMLFANKELRPHPFDPEKAKQLLAEAGYSDSNSDGILDKDGHKLATTLYTYPQRPGLKPMAIAIQQQWQNVGVAVEVRVMDYAAIAETMKPGDIKLSAMASAMIPDPDYFMRKLYSKNGEFNTWGYSNPEVDALLAEGNKIVDPEKRLALYQKIQAIVFEEMPVIPVSYYGVNIVTQRKVKGFIFNPVAHDYMLNTQMTIEP